MMGEAEETLAPPITIFDAEPPGINCASIVLDCADIIFYCVGPRLEIQGVFSGAQPPPHCKFLGENYSNCAAIIFDRTRLLSEIRDLPKCTHEVNDGSSSP